MTVVTSQTDFQTPQGHALVFLCEKHMQGLEVTRTED